MHGLLPEHQKVRGCQKENKRSAGSERGGRLTVRDTLIHWLQIATASTLPYGANAFTPSRVKFTIEMKNQTPGTGLVSRVWDRNASQAISPSDCESGANVGSTS